MEFDIAAKDTIHSLCERYPAIPFLALGQTIFWDEPAKAGFVQLLSEAVPQAVFWHGIHDTDYFSRLPRPLPGPRHFALIEHNDTLTQGLWVAMCEASRLFGAEVVPTKARLRQYGGKLAKIASAQSSALPLDALTSTWGWQAVISTRARDLVARDILLADLAEELTELMQGALQGTVETLADPKVRKRAQQTSDQLIAELVAFAQNNPAATLTQLYHHLLPLLYRLLLGAVPGNLKLTASSAIFQFNPNTANRPRFAPLNIFLQPQTRHLARRAYDAAVAGSGIYTLDQFGFDALPFDAVIPGRGRGTISVSPKEIIIHTSEPLVLPLSKPVEDVTALAEILSSQLGNEVCIVGKAVVLIPMIAQEFILVFHQGASAYTEHTHELVESLNHAGISLKCHPILRLYHKTWDSLGSISVNLNLSAHLAEAFGKHELTSTEFSQRWSDVSTRQVALLHNLADAKKPAALLSFLSGYHSAASLNAPDWPEKLTAYLAARKTLRCLGHKIAHCQQKISRLRDEAYRTRQDLQRPPEFETWIKQKQAALLDLQAQVRQLRAEQQAVVASAEYIAARTTLVGLENTAELERLRLIRNAILTTDGLEATNRRPTGWWFPLLSPDGAWFAQLARTSALMIESFCPDLM